ncbi:MAG TPA: redox-regulated ATPase YchF [Saprospiraceae bacterium]|nr:redox-regulated ATPase YchF [Saprospiraceae bacterium]MCB9328403.1 redox-regulated ATPase YchF [Lewinellaceae bacterium]HRX28991.1 redox-regulated ATPase YchF [Saprospiraceae bacterium]
MGLKCGIVGLPNVGKSTLFNALTSAKALAANYPFATKEPNIGVIVVPDERLDKLAELVKPQRILPTNVDIVDIAGLIKGASKGEGLGNQFLANIREVDAIVHVVRCFDNDNVIHVDGSIDPVRDKEIIDTELILKDLETAEKKLDKYKKSAKGGDKKELHKVEFVEKVLKHLEDGRNARSMEVSEEDLEVFDDLYLLTSKPILYVCNVDEDSATSGNEYTHKFKEFVKDENAEVILISAGIEAEIAELDDEDERTMFVQEMGLDEPGVNKLIKSSYKLLNLITYFTAGEKEVRAWTVKNGSKAPQAAGVIHTDFEKGFIRAEVIKYADFIKFGSEHAVKEAGKLSVEGKEYVVHDGDIMHFRFNV